jgi:hypothetical protein
VVVLAPLFGVLLGSAAALALGTPRSDAVSRWARDLVRFYAVITFAPAAAYAALLEGDWAALYLVRSGELRLLGLVACAALGTAAVPFTFDACARYARRQSRIASWLSVGAALTTLTIAFAVRERLSHLGTTVEFQGGAPIAHIATTVRGVTLLAIFGVAAFGTFVLLRALFVVGAEPPQLGARKSMRLYRARPAK